MSKFAGHRSLALLNLLVVLACLLASPATNAEIELPQADGSVLLLDQPAERIISLAPNITEILFAAGAGDLVLATVEYSDYPPEAAELPRIGDAFRFDLESILAYRPHLVIGWQTGNPETALAKLESLGLPVWRTEIRNPDDIANVLQQAGRATGRTEAAELAAEAVRGRLDKLRDANKDKRPLSYFYQVAERPLYTVNGEHLISQGLAICGAVNIFFDLPALAPQISPEAVLQADPGVLMAPRLSGQPDPLAQWLEWPRLEAVKSGQLMYLPADQISRAAPRMLDSIEFACKVLDGYRAENP